MKIKVVNEILAQIDAFHKPTIYVFNKTDQVKTRKFSPLKKEFAEYNPCFISTYTGEGLDTLKQIIASETHALKNQH